MKVQWQVTPNEYKMRDVIYLFRRQPSEGALFEYPHILILMMWPGRRGRHCGPVRALRQTHAYHAVGRALDRAEADRQDHGPHDLETGRKATS